MHYYDSQIQDTIFERLAKDAAAQRMHGRVAVALFMRPKGRKITAVLDELAGQLGFAALGEKWVKLKAAAAQDLLMRALAFDLAYDEEVLPADKSLVLAERFINYFGKGTRYFANAQVAERPKKTKKSKGEENLATPGGLADITPISSPAGHDAGIIALDAERMAILWVVDEE